MRKPPGNFPRGLDWGEDDHFLRISAVIHKAKIAITPSSAITKGHITDTLKDSAASSSGARDAAAVMAKNRNGIYLQLVDGKEKAPEV